MLLMIISVKKLKSSVTPTGVSPLREWLENWCGDRLIILAVHFGSLMPVIAELPNYNSKTNIYNSQD